MPIKFPCPHCNRSLSVPSKRANTEVVCPKCHQGLTVPAAASRTSTSTASKQRSKKTSARSKAPSVDNAAPLSEIVIVDKPPTEASTAAHTKKIKRARRLADQPVNENALAIPRYVLYLQGILLLVLALVAFSLGLLVGGLGGKLNRGGTAGLQPVVVSGKVTFVSVDGLTSNDDGCVVFLLPRGTFPGTKIPVDGLLPSDPTPDQDHPGIQEIKRIGGDHSRSKVTGDFRVNLSTGGRFYLLVISRNKERMETIPTNHLAEIGDYFDSTKKLLGDRQYRWTKEVIRSNHQVPIKFQ